MPDQLSPGAERDNRQVAPCASAAHTPVDERVGPAGFSIPKVSSQSPTVEVTGRSRRAAKTGSGYAVIGLLTIQLSQPVKRLGIIGFEFNHALKGRPRVGSPPGFGEITAGLKP